MASNDVNITDLYIKYNLNAFDSEEAKKGHLVLVVKKTFNLPTIANYTVDDDSIVSENNNLIGAGIATYNKISNTFNVCIKNKVYAFNSTGTGINENSKNLILKLGTITLTVSSTGAPVATNEGLVKLNDQGRIIKNKTKVLTSEKAVIIDALSPKDLFASKILESIISKMEGNPTELDNSTISYYCQSAYRWAANMMTAAANSRFSLDDTCHTRSVKEQNVGTLLSNTEKLLNNLIFNILKNLEEETITTSTPTRVPSENLNTIDGEGESNNLGSSEGESGGESSGEESDNSEGSETPSGEGGETPPAPTVTSIYSNRVSIPKLIDWLNSYTDWLNSYIARTPDEEDSNDTKTTVGLNDLIEAIKELGENQSSTVDFTSLTTAITAPKTVTISGTMPFPYINIGNSGKGTDSSHPFHVEDTNRNKNIALQNYNSVAEAQLDGWTNDGQTWTKEGYASVSGGSNANIAKTLPTCRYMLRVSIIELPALTELVKRIADLMQANQTQLGGTT